MAKTSTKSSVATAEPSVSETSTPAGDFVTKSDLAAMQQSIVTALRAEMVPAEASPQPIQPPVAVAQILPPSGPPSGNAPVIHQQPAVGPIRDHGQVPESPASPGRTEDPRRQKIFTSSEVCTVQAIEGTDREVILWAPIRCNLDSIEKSKGGTGGTILLGSMSGKVPTLGGCRVSCNVFFKPSEG